MFKILCYLEHTSALNMIQQLVDGCLFDSFISTTITNSNWTGWSALCIGNHIISSAIWYN